MFVQVVRHWLCDASRHHDVYVQLLDMGMMLFRAFVMVSPSQDSHSNVSRHRVYLFRKHILASPVNDLCANVDAEEICPHD